MHVNLLRRVPYQVAELIGEELLSCCHICVAALEIWEVITNACSACGNLFGEEIEFVEEEHQARLLEVATVGNGLEEHQSFMHLVLVALLAWDQHTHGHTVKAHSILVFDQNVIETADGYKEQDDLYVVENVNPLLSLRALTTDVKHLESQVSGIEDGLTDTCRSKACTQDVLVSGNIVLFEEPAEITHVAMVMSVSSLVLKREAHTIRGCRAGHIRDLLQWHPAHHHRPTSS